MVQWILRWTQVFSAGIYLFCLKREILWVICLNKCIVCGETDSIYVSNAFLQSRLLIRWTALQTWDASESTGRDEHLICEWKIWITKVLQRPKRRPEDIHALFFCSWKFLDCNSSMDYGQPIRLIWITEPWIPYFWNWVPHWTIDLLSHKIQ